MAQLASRHKLFDGSTTTVSEKSQQEGTPNWFADEYGWDRRTIKRRLVADGVQPLRVEGNAEYYSQADVFRVMERAGDAGERPAVSIARIEAATTHAFSVACDSLPGAVRELTGQPKAQADLLAGQIWLILTAKLGNYLSAGRPASEGPVYIPVPKSIQDFFASRGKRCEVYRHEAITEVPAAISV